ncbi:uncharacterized protein LOC110458736 isoform X2 [Mizuhopecten yessoensis]|uniref:non-specific serine/threonine protein kinase n=1 Tax=Mizuhopecten yessoensis TaxID=6573 RepID=A0A210Q5Y7_MIZYE|nr:uncharacterized protein LOC110458736 isoform X2 [Mizuhopecten yessoensis]OWF44162.1 Mediator of RNA polymerase II transcription subunit 25 [Mizuhopecten yessoensis]
MQQSQQQTQMPIQVSIPSASINPDQMSSQAITSVTDVPNTLSSMQPVSQSMVQQNSIPSSGKMPHPTDPTANIGLPAGAQAMTLPNPEPTVLRDRKIIWAGRLEWREKMKSTGPPPIQVSRLLQCQLSSGLTDPVINASNWPTDLIMQLIPQFLLNSSQLTPLFKKSRQVGFHFNSDNLEALCNLYKVMQTGFAGCVHFPSSSQCEVRVLLLLFSSKRKAFIGLIPNDQTAFVNEIRNAVYAHKVKQQKIQGAPGSQPVKQVTPQQQQQLLGPSQAKKSRPGDQGQSTGGNNLPAEILQMDPYSIQLYQKCLEEKEEADYSLRVIVIGQTEVGKTTLTRNLLRLPRIIPPESARSTDGVDIHYSFVNLHDNDWNTVGTDMQHAGQSLNARLIQSLKSTTSNERAEPKIDGESSDQTSLTSEDGSFSAGEFDNDTPVGDLVLETVKNLVMSQKVPSGDFDYTKLGELSVWDFAGQFVFYTTHHTFLTHRAVYLLVTRLDQNINDTVDNDQCFLDATGCKKMKIKDFVSYWMNSVHLYSGAAEHLPPVILVGTHLDKVEGDIEKKNKSYFEDIKKYLLETPTSCHLIDRDYTVSDPPDELELESLRQKIVELASQQTYWGEKIPAKWITLEKALMEKKIEGVNIMSYDNVVKLDENTGVPIDDEEKLDLFLRFQHAKGNMIYFSEGCLRNHIVLNPQWLIDAFKCIITARQFCIKNPSLVDHWEALNLSGKLYLGMVDAIFRREDRFCEHKGHILGLMERLHIISHHVGNTDDDKSDTSEKEFYFVPSLLKDNVTECKMETYVKGTNRTPYLCYVFKNNFLPTAVFHRLVAACLSKYSVAKQGKQFLIFCGCGIFDLNGGLTRLVVTFYDNIIQIGLFRFSREKCAPETSTCVLVRQFVTETLERVLGRYHMNLPFTLHLKCGKSPLLSHEGLLSVKAVQSGDQDVACHDHEKESHIISRRCLLQLWFPDQVSATDTNEEVDQCTSGNNFGQPGAIPNEKLRRISTKIGKEFKALACHLGLIEAEIDQIQSDHPHNTKEQIYQILVSWTQKSGPQATEQCLREAFRNSGINVEILSEPEISSPFL